MFRPYRRGIMPGSIFLQIFSSSFIKISSGRFRTTKTLSLESLKTYLHELISLNLCKQYLKPFSVDPIPYGTCGVVFDVILVILGCKS